MYEATAPRAGLNGVPSLTMDTPPGIYTAARRDPAR